MLKSVFAENQIDFSGEPWTRRNSRRRFPRGVVECRGATRSVMSSGVIGSRDGLGPETKAKLSENAPLLESRKGVDPSPSSGPTGAWR